eukprot:1629935-Rhodomonas_salina.3
MFSEGRDYFRSRLACPPSTSTNEERTHVAGVMTLNPEDGDKLEKREICFLTKAVSNQILNLDTPPLLTMMKGGQVRRPDLIKPYIPPPPVHQDDIPPDYPALVSLLSGLFGLLLKVTA